MPFNGITIHEGYNDLGFLEYDITDIKQEVQNIPIQSLRVPPTSTLLLFKFMFSDAPHNPIPSDFKVVLTVRDPDGGAMNDVEYISYPNSDGFIEIQSPVWPSVSVSSEIQKIIRYHISGPLDERSKESYLKVLSATGETLYTLITDFLVHDGYLCVTDGDNNYYKVQNPELAIDLEYISAININKSGLVSLFLIEDNLWEDSDTFTFYGFQHPENLVSVSDGFYNASGDVGDIYSANLREGYFTNFSGVIINSEPYKTDVNVKVYYPNVVDPFYTHLFHSLVQGTLNYTSVYVEGTIPAIPDNSPTLHDIETITGITFSTAFSDFLASRGIDTVNTARKAGPITYIEGYPSSDVGVEELAALQSHTDLYMMNQNIDQNQRIMNQGYNNLFKIANTPKNVFVDDVVDEGLLPLFQAAKIHEIATQNQKLVANLLAGTLTDLRLATPATPNIEGSTFVREALGKAISSCGCSDCKSNVSPFAYLMDLIKYGAAHIDHTTSPSYTHGGAASNFISVISSIFLQPFGTLNVDCATLHDEFCRVRLVTEVLEKYIANQISGSFTPPTSAQITALAAERKQFLMLIYRTILLQAGTSLEELRNVVTTLPAADKIIAAQKLSDKLGIPLYMPSAPTTLTADRMWLTFTATFFQELTAVNIEAVFGFRDTQRNVLTTTPVSLIEQWHSGYLRNVWKTEDYPLTSYSREGVVPSNNATFKSNWKPIIDPDNIGWTDFTYLNDSTNYPASTFTKDLWNRRKEDTDDFLTYCLTDSTVISRTSVDLNNRILKVTNRNITTQVIDSDTIQIENPATTWNNYTLIARTLVQTDTNVILKKSTPSLPQPAMLQPVGTNPKMRYKRILVTETVIVGGTPTNITLTWANKVIMDQLPGGYAKLVSTSDATVYQTSDSSLFSITYASNGKQVDFSITSVFPSGFLAGTVRFFYEVEVPLYTDVIMDPEKISVELFSTSQNYNLLSPTPSGMTSPLPYKVWDATGLWPSFLTGSDYEKLKQMYLLLSAGNYVSEITDIITINLHLTKAEFNRMMQLLIATENYSNSMYTAKRPLEQDLYEVSSIFRTSAKTPLRDTWVKEEIKHIDGSSNPIILRLSSQFFWKSLTEPVSGPWDPSLQTIPSTIGAITSYNNAIIDPELLLREDMIVNPEAKPYRDLYDTRKIVLDAKYTNYLAMVVPFYVNGFTEMLNEISTGSTGSSFVPNISPYTTLAEIITDLQSTNAFNQKEATDVLWYAFSMNSSDFLSIYKVKVAYELNDPMQMPTDVDIQKSIKLLVSAYKRKQLFPGGSGWIADEISGTYTPPVFYYNVIKMKLAPGRGDAIERSEWQNTLKSWNRLPIIQPDIVPPENIINFTSANWVYTKWNSRNNALTTDYNTLTASYINNSGNADNLLDRLQHQIDNVVARVNSYVPLSSFPTPMVYYPYFADIKVKESAGEDIRPFLEQLGINITEYRFLRNIIHVLESAGTGAIPLIDTEYEDIRNILIAIHSRNLPFAQVLEEYNSSIILDQDYFQIYKPSVINFPLTDLPVYNQWRSPYNLRKAWADRLQTRIDSENRVKERWKDVLMEAEDRNMPLLRDALIRALTNACENWQDAAERLAKTFFIETKDNCCVKHTRVSFAIETLQGLLWALETGIYDNFVTNFTLTAPQFKEEWKWIGSYATWRSAMFVFLYPENLLYPTLRRNQSEKFVELSNTLNSNNSFSPEDACHAAEDYQKYLDDIQNLEPICSTSFNEYQYFYSDPNSCCTGNTLTGVFKTYLFAQGISGTVYYCVRNPDDKTETAVSQWRRLPIANKSVKVIGAISLGEIKDTDNQTNPIYGPKSSTLYVFYTYLDKGKLVLAYITKNLNIVNADWAAEKQTADIPAYTYNANTSYSKDYQVTSVVLCQSTRYWDKPSFIFSYTLYGVLVLVGPNPTNVNTISTYQTYNYKNNKFENYIDSQTYSEKVAINAIRMQFFNSSFAIADKGIAIVYENSIYFSSIDNTIYENSWNDNGNVKKIIGAYNKVANEVIVVYLDNAGAFKVNNLFIFENSSALTVTPHNISGITNQFSTITKICPIFFETNPTAGPNKYFAIKCSTNTNLILCSGIYIGYYNAATLQNFLDPSEIPLVIAPEIVNNVSIQSGECIQDFSARALNIKTKIRKNLNDPPGTSSTDVIRVIAVKDLLYEAYYFVPMLLALDQQKRGQFDSALAWYKSVYDYTNALLAKRKIFYGLVLEQTIPTTFLQAPNWLLDPLNPHLIAQTRARAYTKYTIMNIIQCLYSYADQLFTLDTSDTVPVARKMYTTALELLQTTDLNYKTNQCIAKANYCLNTSIPMYGSAERMWANMFSSLKDNVASLGDADLIEDAVGGLVDLYNDDYPDISRFFDQATEFIEGIRPPAPTPQTITEVVNGNKDRTNNAYRYLSALNNIADFNNDVADKYARAVAYISGLNVDDVASIDSEQKIGWLYQPIPTNTTDYQFRFANTDGEQYLTGGRSYDPIWPEPEPFTANLNYTNAPIIIEIIPTGMPVSYTPLIDFVFCVPQNPIYNALQLKGNVELYKIFNCRNIAGIIRELNIYPASTDSVSGLPIIGGTGNLTLPGINNYTPSQYRFQSLIDRAQQIAQQAQQMESLFLAALEKEDAENYAQLRAKQDLETATATIKLQDLRINQANDEQDIAYIQLSKVTFSQNHFSDLLAQGMNSYEKQTLSLLKDQIETLEGAAITSTAASFLNLAKGGGDLLTGTLSTLAQITSVNSSISSQLASFERMSKEWNYQKQLAGFDISLANQQIKIANDNIRIVTQERDISVLNNTHAQDSLAFLQNKFTNADLYNFMSNVLGGCYNYMLNLGTAIARSAESQLYFERQEQAGPFILNDYWETPSSGFTSGSSSKATDRKGLTGSARLLVDITKLQQYALDSYKRKLQLTKVISLAQNFPSEFQGFKETGIFNFSLTNQLFDYDFPGHYIRLINSVQTTVVGLLPVYDGIKASLTADTISYTVIGGTSFQKIPIRRLEQDSVALTSPNKATGLFQLQPLQNNLLNPFEGMGIESRWQFLMPQFTNRFDFDNIADVLLTVEYTALDSYLYRAQVLQDLDNTLSFNRGFSFKNNFPDQWYELGEAEAGPNEFDVTIELKREFFPQGIDNLKLNGTDIVVYFVREDGFTSEINNVAIQVVTSSSTPPTFLQTINGVLPTGPLMSTIGNSPLVKLKFIFDNTTFENRELFSKGQVKDILLLVGCKADLKAYPL